MRLKETKGVSTKVLILLLTLVLLIGCAAGGTLAILATIGLRKILTQKQLWVAGAIGAVAHSIGQVAMAMLLTGTPGLIVYLPPLICISIVTGLFTGLCAQYLVNRGNLWKIISN
jgi:heptaprenyl diphosphate synthase